MECQTEGRCVHEDDRGRPGVRDKGEEMGGRRRCTGSMDPDDCRCVHTSTRLPRRDDVQYPSHSWYSRCNGKRAYITPMAVYCNMYVLTPILAPLLRQDPPRCRGPIIHARPIVHRVRTRCQVTIVTASRYLNRGAPHKQ